MSSGGLTDRPSFVPAGRNKLEIKQKKQACVNKNPSKNTLSLSYMFTSKIYIIKF